MKANAVLAALAALFLAAAAPSPSDQTVAYTATPVVEDGVLKGLDVNLSFRGDADGETTLSLPDRWAGEVEYWRHLENLRVEGAEATTPNPASRVLTHAPGARITVRYRVTTAFDEDPKVGNENPYRPIIRPRWFSVLGNAVFASPEGDESRLADFRWADVPAGWTVASDLDHASKGRRTTLGDIVESVMVGAPDLTVVTRRAAGAEFRIAIIGRDWTFKPEELGELMGRVIDAERGYWKSPGESYFVALAPMIAPSKDWVSVGGTGRDDGFSLYAGTNSPIASMSYLLAHEHMHTFNPRMLGRMPKGDDEALGYWFSEGFTDFLTHRVLLRSGVWSLEDFVEHLNEELKAYAESPARLATNEEIRTGFWKSYDLSKLPYRRGMLIAHVWDHRLRTLSGGRRDLDDVFQTQLKAAGRQDAAGEWVLATDNFFAAWKQAGGADLSGDVARHVTRGEAVLLPADLFGTCARVETVTRPPFARGWDPEATTAADNIVTGLKDDSPAYKAGLRNGMKIIKRAFGEVGNSQVEYGLRVEVDGKEQLFRFMPVGEGPDMTLQTVVLAPAMDEETRAACARRMSGG
ncbi:MAG TPA: hypothetical protein VEA15_03875 [Caulobacteraceae bacterium]|nr:hypothetical protein [Caulobacteraceae bacterium]